MSHFSVLVVTDERPDHDTLAYVLQPWHEFECTGVDDAYVQEIDKTTEALEAFAVAKVVRLHWDQQFTELFASLRPEQYISVVDCHT